MKLKARPRRKPRMVANVRFADGRGKCPACLVKNGFLSIIEHIGFESDRVYSIFCADCHKQTVLTLKELHEQGLGRLSMHIAGESDDEKYWR